jgi:hypothetical protein
MISDEEEYVIVLSLGIVVHWVYSYRNEVGILHINDATPAGAEDIFGFGNAFVDGMPENALRDGQPFFVPRRHRGVGELWHNSNSYPFITLL